MGPSKIMIVEDNATVAEDCRDCLERLGYDIASVVASGEESIERAESERPDAVLMDIRLRDEMDGIEAAEQIHARFEIPAIFVSAYSDRELLERARRVGSFGYLVKPFEERELCATLEMALYKSKAEKERRRMEARLRQVQKMEGLQLMAGSIAHSFNNMLHATLGNMELALSKLPFDSTARRFLQEANESAQRAADMSMLMLVYVGQGRNKLETVNLSRQVRNTLDILQNTSQEKISLLMNLAHEEIAIKADHAQLSQLIENLFTNAVEAIGEKAGEITVATRVATFGCDELRETVLQENLPAGDYAILELSDTGRGMDGETLSRAFDPFFTTKFMGRGLGLATVLGIARGHNGAVTVESRSGSGEGTTFRVLFPVK